MVAMVIKRYHSW